MNKRSYFKVLILFGLINTNYSSLQRVTDPLTVIFPHKDLIREVYTYHTKPDIGEFTWANGEILCHELGKGKSSLASFDNSKDAQYVADEISTIALTKGGTWIGAIKKSKYEQFLEEGKVPPFVGDPDVDLPPVNLRNMSDYPENANMTEDDRWIWSDGTVWSPLVAQWRPNEPNNDKVQDCVQIFTEGDTDEGTWDDADCEISKSILCRHDRLHDALNEGGVTLVVALLHSIQNFELADRLSQIIQNRSHSNLQEFYAENMLEAESLMQNPENKTSLEDRKKIEIIKNAMQQLHEGQAGFLMENSDNNVDNFASVNDIFIINGGNLSVEYFYYEDEKPWIDAYTICRSIGSTLVVIDSTAARINVEDFIRNHTISDQVWIGINRTMPHDSEVYPWKYVNGAQVNETWANFNWAPGEPNNADGQQECIQMNYMTRGWWDDANCQIEKKFICQKTEILLD